MPNKKSVGELPTLNFFRQDNGGELVFNDKSPPEKIFAVFHLSKAAFKRTVGHLFKQRLIEKVGDNFKLAK